MADIRSFFSSATAATQASSNEAETTRQVSTNNNCHDSDDTFNQVAGHPAATQPVAGAMPMQQANYDISTTKDDFPKQPVLTSYPKHSSSKSDHNR